MYRINVREARRQLKALLDRVQAGEEIVLLRRGEEVARLVPPQAGGRVLPALAGFRAALRIEGEPLSETVIRERKEARY